MRESARHNRESSPDGAKASRPGEEADAAFLHRFGERLRLLRARRGMARRALSAASGVSERYIAQFEAGEGNVSILLLRRISRALGVSAEELVGESGEKPLDLVLLERFLARLDAGRLAEARRLIATHFALPGALSRGARVALVGLRGAGKSTLGRALAERRGVRFVELDREVEQASRMDLRDIFEFHGQDGFRRLEREALTTIVAADTAAVIATGGGLVTEAATFELLLSSCVTVWVRATPEEHMARVVAQGDQRPMASNRQAMDDLRAILASREPLYEKADHVLDTSGRTAAESLVELERLLSVPD